jgi:hypothetical protein
MYNTNISIYLLPNKKIIINRYINKYKYNFTMAKPRSKLITFIYKYKED